MGMSAPPRYHPPYPRCPAAYATLVCLQALPSPRMQRRSRTPPVCSPLPGCSTRVSRGRRDLAAKVPLGCGVRPGPGFPAMETERRPVFDMGVWTVDVRKPCVSRLGVRHGRRSHILCSGRFPSPPHSPRPPLARCQWRCECLVFVLPTMQVQASREASSCSCSCSGGSGSNSSIISRGTGNTNINSSSNWVQQRNVGIDRGMQCKSWRV